jgi:ribosome-associated translation inhibitor RaiA
MGYQEDWIAGLERLVKEIDWQIQKAKQRIKEQETLQVPQINNSIIFYFFYFSHFIFIF